GKQSGQGSRLTRSRRRGNLYPIAAGERRRAKADPKSSLAVGCGVNNRGMDPWFPLDLLGYFGEYGCCAQAPVSRNTEIHDVELRTVS
ncbi:MAG: hypothetical protein ACK553_16275, partial [Planctomycetota bacterium]